METRIGAGMQAWLVNSCQSDAEMTRISDFAQVRADGEVVPSGMTVKEMIALGWGPSKVIALKWSCDGRETEVYLPNGVHGIVVSGSTFVAAIRDGVPGRLVIFSADGSIYGELANRVSFSGQEFSGAYSWFEPAMTPRASVFGVVFQSDENVDLRCDVDASGPSLADVVKVRC